MECSCFSFVTWRRAWAHGGLRPQQQRWPRSTWSPRRAALAPRPPRPISPTRLHLPCPSWQWLDHHPRPRNHSRTSRHYSRYSLAKSFPQARPSIFPSYSSSLHHLPPLTPTSFSAYSSRKRCTAPPQPNHHSAQQRCLSHNGLHRQYTSVRLCAEPSMLPTSKPGRSWCTCSPTSTGRCTSLPSPTTRHCSTRCVKRSC